MEMQNVALKFYVIMWSMYHGLELKNGLCAVAEEISWNIYNKHATFSRKENFETNIIPPPLDYQIKITAEKLKNRKYPSRLWILRETYK